MNSTVNQGNGTSGKTQSGQILLSSGLTLMGVVGLCIMFYGLYKYHHSKTFSQIHEKCCFSKVITVCLWNPQPSWFRFILWLKSWMSIPRNLSKCSQKHQKGKKEWITDKNQTKFPLKKNKLPSYSASYLKPEIQLQQLLFWNDCTELYSIFCTGQRAENSRTTDEGIKNYLMCVCVHIYIVLYNQLHCHIICEMYFTGDADYTLVIYQVMANQKLFFVIIM